HTTSAPHSAKARAIAWPMPRPAPVIRATLPSRRKRSRITISLPCGEDYLHLAARRNSSRRRDNRSVVVRRPRAARVFVMRAVVGVQRFERRALVSNLVERTSSGLGAGGIAEHGRKR